ncbi:MAG TPA: PKD domain-containing protein [Thermoanaerobaculia bacterium]|nr:PKD domain-containing protein [Thermoanaerobaculia bacterium]
MAGFLLLMCGAVSAADCLSGVRLVSTKASVPNLVVGPAAFSGNVLAVAKSEESDPDHIWLGLYGEDLSTIAADRLVATDAADDQAIVALLFTGTEFGLFYRTDDVIRLQRLTVTGDPIGAPIAVNPDRGPRLADQIEVIWSDVISAYVVARHISTGRNRGIWVTVLERDGSERSDVEIPAVPPADPFLAVDVASDGTIGIFHLTTDDNTLLFSRIIAGRFFPQTRSIASFGTNVRTVVIDDLFVVVRQVGEGQTAEIRWFIVNSDDEIVRPDGVLVASDGMSVLQPLGLTAVGNELALTYAIPPSTATVIPDMRLRRFTVAGSLISDTRFAGNDFAGSRALSIFPPVWTGTSFVSAAVREATSRVDSYLVRYCPLRAQIDAPAVVAPGQLVTIRALATGGVPPYKYAWTITRDPGGSRAAQSVQRTFTSLGERLITLVVTDDTGATITATSTISVNEIIVEPVVKKRRRSAKK